MLRSDAQALFEMVHQSVGALSSECYGDNLLHNGSKSRRVVGVGLKNECMKTVGAFAANFHPWQVTRKCMQVDFPFFFFFFSLENKITTAVMRKDMPF